MYLKLRAKTLLGNRLYVSLRNLRYTKAASLLRAAPSFPGQVFRQRANAPYLPFDVRMAIGMGAMLTHIVQLLAYSEQNSFFPICRISNPLYSNGADVFLEYFELRTPRPPVDREFFFHTIESSEDYIFFKPKAEPSLNEMGRVFHKYLGFSRRVSDAVDDFLLNIPMFPRLGVHYRATDKIYEAPEVNYKEVFTAVERFATSFGANFIFLATDSAKFSAAIRARFPKIDFISFDSEISQDIDGPRHFSGLSADAKAMEAFLNMILLSRCEVCIRTASQLSAWSRILNKDLKTVTLNRPFFSDAYPENEMWNEEHTVIPPS